MSPSSSRSCSDTARRRRTSSCSTFTTRARPSSPADRARRPSSTSSACSSTVCGRPCNMTIRSSVRRTRDGFYKLSLSTDERALLAELPAQMRALFANGDDAAIQRLRPVAYPDDADRQTEYRLLVQDELM